MGEEEEEGGAVKENRWKIVKGRGRENSGGKRRKMAREL